MLRGGPFEGPGGLEGVQTCGHRKEGGLWEPVGASEGRKEKVSFLQVEERRLGPEEVCAKVLPERLRLSELQPVEGVPPLPAV